MISVSSDGRFQRPGIFIWVPKDTIISYYNGDCVYGFFIVSMKLWMQLFSKEAVDKQLTVICIFVLVIIAKWDVIPEEDDTSKLYCFQIDEVSHTKDNQTEIKGVAFLYLHEDRKPAIVLKSTSDGKSISMNMKCGIPTSYINDYFSCNHDYTTSGFRATATGISKNEEYEILIKWQWLPALSTGAFITGDNIHYIQSKKYIAPDMSNINANASELAEVVKNGILRVYRPDYHCWIYQLSSSIYWIVDQDFYFEDDGSTYIQYQLFTTKYDSDPIHRFGNNLLGANLGGNFEDYEILGLGGPYRIMKRDLPKDFPITSIVTGYTKNGLWVWKSYFRPIYTF